MISFQNLQKWSNFPFRSFSFRISLNEVFASGNNLSYSGGLRMDFVLSVYFLDLERIVRTYLNDTVLMYPVVGIRIWKTWTFLKFSNLTKSRRELLVALSIDCKAKKWITDLPFQGFGHRISGIAYTVKKSIIKFPQFWVFWCQPNQKFPILVSWKITKMVVEPQPLFKE